jgi:hypothetical protein
MKTSYDVLLSACFEGAERNSLSYSFCRNKFHIKYKN